MPKSRFRKIAQRLVRDDVLSALRGAILEGRFKAGERVVEREIAEQMGLSRGPVREALRELEQEGLITSHAYRGARVASFTARDIEEIYELRSLLEGYAVRLAVVKANRADLDRLQDILDEMRALARGRDLSALVEKDLEFHREICRLSANSRLLKAWSSLGAQIRLFLVLADQAFFEPEYIAEMHTPTIEAMRRKDADLAERTIKEPMFEVMKVIVEAMIDQQEQTPAAGAKPEAAGAGTDAGTAVDEGDHGRDEANLDRP